MMKGDVILLIGWWLVIFSRFLSGNSDSRLAQASGLAPALYVLGDSLLDSGNNNFLPTLAKANFQPYGVNFPNGATGRFTNGRTVADFIAEFLGLPMPPPFMSFRNSGALTGLNYASGSCGILPETGNFMGRCLKLDDQIDMFGETVKYDLSKHHGSTEELSEYLSKSIFLVSTGSNDYINNYLEPNLYDSSKRYTPQSFAQLLTDSLSHKLERLYQLGARKIVMFEIGPIGCMPTITRKYKHNGQCVEEFNKLVSLFNDQLGTILNNLTSTLPGSTFVLGHVHWLGYDAITNPSTYGLRDVSDACCTTWANGTSGCIPELQPCTPTDNHYFWDAFHLTEAVYSVIAARCINDTSVCMPTSIEELRLYQLGARKIVMFEIGPIGCMPTITRQYKHNGQCVEEFNKLVSLFNDQLGTILNNLTSTLPGSTFVLGHVHWLGYDAITNPSTYGLRDVSDACCTTWANGTSGCIPELQPCTPTDNHYFWDAFHLTEAVYSVIAARCINDTSVCKPTSITELVQV